MVVTLIYLAAQVNQSKALLEKNEKIALSQVNQARMDSKIAHLARGAQEDMAEILVKVFSDRHSMIDPIDQLNDVEQHRLRSHVHQHMLIVANTGESMPALSNG